MDSRDGDSIQQQVRARKQRAKSLNLLQITEDLYDDLKYMPASMNRDGSTFASIVSGAVYSSDEPRFKKVLLTMKSGSNYIVEFNENNDIENFTYYEDYTVFKGYEMSLYLNEQRVLGVEIEAHSDNEFPVTHYVAKDISAFREGDWIEDLRKLHQINRAETEKVLAKIENDRISKLCDDFGLE